jgi:eukaryotic-like serine/threonine-protein kinase
MLLGNHYQAHNPIGRGSLSTVYSGVDTHTGLSVAIKVLSEVYSTDPKFVRRFQREARAASDLKHPNIVQVYNYGQTDGKYYIVMELIDGTDLRHYLHSRGILDAENTVKIAVNVALGLGEAHRRGIIHRNVKPTKILLGHDGSIKLTGFSIASVYGPYYSPEQAMGEIVTPAADVYSLGMVMYEMLTCHPPFDGDSPVAVAMKHIHDTPKLPSQFNPNIPGALEEIIMRCLEKAPDMRYSDGSEMARSLEALLEV